MAVTETLDTYSRTEASNTPQGSDTIGTDLDNHLRNIKFNVTKAADWSEQAAKTAAYTTAATDIHTVVRVDASATGSILITLLAAATAGDGFTVAIGQAAATGTVNVTGNSSETINGTATIGVRGSFTTVVLTCDGSNWNAIGVGTVPGTFGATLMEAETAGVAALAVFPSLSGITAGAAVVAVSGSDDLVSAGFTLEEVLVENTVAIFYQAAAPNTWAVVAGSGDFLLGVDQGTINPGSENSAGAAVTGSWTISGLTNAGVELTKAQIPSHVHTQAGAGSNTFDSSGGTQAQQAGTANTGDGTADGLAAGNGATHTHTSSSDASWRPKIAYCMRASKSTPVALP
jgi:hypothetical protein